MLLLIFIVFLMSQQIGTVRIKNCTPPLGSYCVEITECKFFVDLLQKSPIPRPRSVVRVLHDHHCGFHKNVPKVCCPAPHQQSGKTVNIRDLLYHKNIKLLPFDSCGEIYLHSRIINGYRTVPLEFPWMALIAHNLSSGLDFGCAGTVINDNYVLTAAHCVYNLEVHYVRLGEHDIESVRDCNPITGECAPPVQNVNVGNVIIHPEYTPQTFTNDTALIRLANKANFNQANIQPICLPFGIDAGVNLHGKMAIISGWGVTESGFRDMKLRKTFVPIISNTACKELYQRRLSISDDQICAGGFKGRDSCGGDSGGPLKLVGKIGNKSRFIQYGVVSYGPTYCGTDGQPGVYTRIRRYLKWILDSLEP